MGSTSSILSSSSSSGQRQSQMSFFDVIPSSSSMSQSISTSISKSISSSSDRSDPTELSDSKRRGKESDSKPRGKESGDKPRGKESVDKPAEKKSDDKPPNDIREICEKAGISNPLEEATITDESDLRRGDIVVRELMDYKGLYHLGIYIGPFVISKYQEEGGVLLKEMLDCENWIGFKKYKSGGAKTADNALARFKEGEKIPDQPFAAKDIIPFEHIEGNCENFVDDCLDLKGVKEKSSQIFFMLKVMSWMSKNM